MSIFPKRTIPGKGVTIHWNFNTAHLKGTHIFPFVRIAVKSPEGEITILHEGNMLALPDDKEIVPETSGKPAYRYLNKNTPLLVMADYLSGPFKKEALIDILGAIQSGRHYYFHYPIPENAALGKYTLISEVHSNGEIRYSKTAADDYFFVEQLCISAIKNDGDAYAAIVKNTSSEPVPVKIVQCIYSDQELKTKVQVLELAPEKETVIHFENKKTFLFYNEEREVLSLSPDENKFPLRNQQLLSLYKNEVAAEVVYVIKKDADDSYKLEGPAFDIWKNADGLSAKKDILNPDHKTIYAELIQSRLIDEIAYNK